MLNKLYVELSSLCNLNCKMCFRSNWFDETQGLMPYDTAARVKCEIERSSAKTVFFGGMGEPLMHPMIAELVGTAVSCKKYTEIISNGTNLDETMAKKLIGAGLDRLWISMDGFSKRSYESIRKGSMYETIRRNIDVFNSLRGNCELGITFVMMRENIHELEKINTFADDVGVDIINLSHVIPGEAMSKEDSIYDSNYPVGKMRRLDGISAVKQVDFCTFVDEGTCFIRWDGEVCPCMQLLHNSYSYLYEERRKIYFKSYGNINDKSLEDIWNGEEFMKFRERVRAFEYPCCTICMGCDDRRENKKDCMYNEEPTCGACLWANGLVRCP